MKVGKHCLTVWLWRVRDWTRSPWSRPTASCWTRSTPTRLEGSPMNHIEVLNLVWKERVKLNLKDIVSLKQPFWNCNGVDYFGSFEYWTRMVWYSDVWINQISKTKPGWFETIYFFDHNNVQWEDKLWTSLINRCSLPNRPATAVASFTSACYLLSLPRQWGS